MKIETTKWKSHHVQSATYRSANYVEEALERAEKLKNDKEAAKRYAKRNCKACYYLRGRVGGAAITEANCAICGEVMSFSNTNVDKICEKCADAHKLCRHCGGDSEMRTKRRRFNWEVQLDTNKLPQEALASS